MLEGCHSGRSEKHLQPNGLAVSCGCPFGFMMPTATDIEADFVVGGYFYEAVVQGDGESR